MIPKIIHYCWFGGNPLPPLAQECIASWRKFLPDYEIREWNESNFDVNSIPYTAEAYRQKKYAFVSDYARFWIIYHYGGLCFDTDVEVIKPLDDILKEVSKGSKKFQVSSSMYGFMGFEQDPDGVNTPGKYAPRYCFAVNPGVGFGMTKGHPLMKRMMEVYDGLQFEAAPADISWYKTIVAYTTEELCKLGLKNTKGIQTVFSTTNLTNNTNSAITVYPAEYFAPIQAITGRLHITKNTRTIHRYAASWNEKKQKSAVEIVKHYMPEWVLVAINRWKRRSYRIDPKPNHRP